MIFKKVKSQGFYNFSFCSTCCSMIYSQKIIWSKMITPAQMSIGSPVSSHNLPRRPQCLLERDNNKSSTSDSNGPAEPENTRHLSEEVRCTMPSSLKSVGSVSIIQRRRANSLKNQTKYPNKKGKN